jgi:excisionase family DNA binding protein
VPKFLKDREIAEMIGCSRSTVWRMVDQARLPQPVRLGGMTRWRADEVLVALQE